MRQIPILAGKSISKATKLLNRSGSTWSGHLALKIDSEFVKKILKKNPGLKIVLVAGTNGKTTTAKFIQEVFEENGIKAFRNSTGANLINGVASTLIKHVDLNGKINYDTAIFEIDENTLPRILSELKNTNNDLSVILLNLFRDQLDRYGEVNTIAKNWLDSLKNLKPSVNIIINGDDPMLSYLGKESKLNVSYFGLDSKLMKAKKAGHDIDFIYCPNCGKALTYSKRSYSHMGIFSCPKCSFKNQKTEIFEGLPNPMLGIYNKYNINAAATLLEKVFNIQLTSIKNVLEKFSPAFGRQEGIKYKGKNVFLLLSKNPTGFNQSIAGILEQDKKPHVLLLLNDRIPDGRDVSWIWDVDFEQLVKAAEHITVSGDRCYDMGLRIKYSISHFADRISIKMTSDKQQTKNNFKIEEDLKNAINIATRETSKNETLYILATYSAMLEARKILKGRSIL